MKKIKFSIKDKTLTINYKTENNAFKNINNTNIITDEDLIFDSKYLKNNLNLVAGFLNVLITNEKVTKAIIIEESLIEVSFDLLNYIPNITDLVIMPDISVDYNMHLLILKNDTLKKINCYSIPPYLLERIDTTKKIIIETRCEVYFLSDFIKSNNLSSYTEVFYKKKLIINTSLTVTDWEDFNTFLSINTYLKTIYFNYINISLVKKVIKLLEDNHKKNINMSIMGTKENLNYFEDLSTYVKKNKYINKNNIKFKIEYSREYKKENFFKLLNFTTVKYLLIVIILSSIAGYGISEYDIYQSSKQVNSINDDITDLLEEYVEYDLEDVTPEDNTGEVVETPTSPSKPTKPTYVSPYYKDFSKVISVLKESNPDTVGWLTVKNTTVNYPVVQSTNNSYYLTHDFNRNSNSLGWVFMDYRNNATDLQKNTVIYGHNIAKAKLMFGNLSATLSSSWYTKDSNQIITFNTANADMSFRIFSIYKVATTNDYLYNTFNSDEEFLSFVDKMKSRSIYNFGTTINSDDKILTLSTCQSSGKERLVVHAVLLK